MQRYQNSITGAGGVLIATPTVTVRVANATPNSGALATLFSDNAVSPTSLANPFTGDSRGNFFFYVEDGRYDIAISGGTPVITTFTIADVEISDESYTQFSVKDFGAKGDGTTDDTAAIQAAIDFGDTLVAGNSEAPIIWFPPGRYVLTAQIDWTSSHLVGAFPNNSVRIIWNGTAGATVFVKDSTSTGGVSFARLEGIMFINGTTRPGTWLNISGAAADKFFNIRNVQFQGCSGDAIQIDDGWFNFHIAEIRFDEVGGFAIDAATRSAQNLSSFVLEHFTYDARTLGAPGFIRFSNVTNNVSNAGTVRISDARIEINTAWTGNQALVTISYPDSSANARWIGVELFNISYQDNAPMASDVMFYGDSSDTTIAPAVIHMCNVRAEGISATIGGNWHSWTIPIPTAGNYNLVSLSGDVVETHNYLAGRSIRTDLHDGTFDAFQARVKGNSDARFAVTGLGQIEIGGGSAAADVVLNRSAADTLRLATGDKFIPQTTGQDLGGTSNRWDAFLEAVQVFGAIELDGDLNHDGTNVGFFDVTPADRPGTTEDIKDGLTTLGLLNGTSATPLDLDGGVLTTPVIDPLEGTLSNVPRWIFKLVDFGDMTAAATADTFTLWTLPANTMIHDVVGTVVTGWSGGSISAAVASVGTQAGPANGLTLDDNFFTTGTRYELHDGTAVGGKGSVLFDSTDKFAPFMLLAGGVIELQMDLTGDNHVNATAGQARIYMLVSQPLGNTTTEAN